MANLDWSQCPAVESVPGKVSGAWVLKGTRMPVSAIFENLDLRGHLKSGQWWSLQNRPTERGLGQGCFTPLPPEEASLFLCANSVDRI
jgi:hypothetical protein